MTYTIPIRTLLQRSPVEVALANPPFAFTSEPEK
jgi:hypothetical protein